MSKRLPVDVKEARRHEHVLKRNAAREARAKKLSALIKKHGSAFAAAKSLDITPQAFYERMEHVGLVPHGYDLLPGEPKDPVKKVRWLKGLITNHSVKDIAKRYHRSVSAIHDRMQRYGLRARRRFNDGPDAETRKAWLERLLKKHHTGYRVAKRLGVSASAVYERMERYGLVQRTLAKAA